jgi:hypothetical protein
MLSTGVHRSQIGNQTKEVTNVKLNSNWWQRVLSIFGLVAIMLGLMASLAPSASARNPNPGVIPPHARPYGHTYGEWSNMFWQWAFSIPVHDSGGSILNPLADTTGDRTRNRCAVGQSGHVWFLAGLYNAGGTVVRNCTMPTGKAIFFPIWNIENENITWPPHYPPYTLLELRQQVEDVMQQLNGCPACSAEVDGVPIEGVFGDGDRIGYGNPAFTITIPADNLFAYVGYPADAGVVDPVISDGWYVMLAPLRAGQHTVHFAGGGLDVTYHLTITR